MNTRNRNAFTLVEVIIALVVSSISLLGLIRLHLISISMAEAAEMISQAVLLAEEKIAETLAMGYPVEGIKSGQVEKKSQVLHWHTEVTELKSPKLIDAEITGLRKIYVEIGFKQRTGSKSLHMSTYVADRRLR
jgi:prepilin-type N-terminal cleavage/methylation domain-containing protein